MTGIDLIATERERQINEEQYSPGHDRSHASGELVAAAINYAAAALGDGDLAGYASGWWPDWEWKPAGRERNLVKAGALIAAELDRMQGP